MESLLMTCKCLLPILEYNCVVWYFFHFRLELFLFNSFLVSCSCCYTILVAVLERKNSSTPCIENGHKGTVKLFIKHSSL